MKRKEGCNRSKGEVVGGRGQTAAARPLNSSSEGGDILNQVRAVLGKVNAGRGRSAAVWGGMRWGAKSGAQGLRAAHQQPGSYPPAPGRAGRCCKVQVPPYLLPAARAALCWEVSCAWTSAAGRADGQKGRAEA